MLDVILLPHEYRGLGIYSFLMKKVHARKEWLVIEADCKWLHISFLWPRGLGAGFFRWT